MELFCVWFCFGRSRERDRAMEKEWKGKERDGFDVEEDWFYCDLCAVGARQTIGIWHLKEKGTKSDIFVVFELFGMGRNG